MFERGTTGPSGIGGQSACVHACDGACSSTSTGSVGKTPKDTLVVVLSGRLTFGGKVFELLDRAKSLRIGCESHDGKIAFWLLLLLEGLKLSTALNFVGSNNN